MDRTKEFEALDELVRANEILAYEFEVIKDPECPGSRETDQLKITFPSGKVLTFSTFCSGSAENTVLIVE